MAHKRYRIEFTQHTPLLIGDRQALGNYRSSDIIVPGRTWRGALAAWLRDYDRNLFDDVFNANETAHLGSLFPTEAGRDPKIATPTLFSCKHYPGYLNVNTSDDPDDMGHGVYDTLVRQFVNEVFNQRVPSLAFTDELRCPYCNAPGDRFNDIHATVRRNSTTHVAINRRRRVAMNGQLYTREGVELDSQQSRLVGYIDMPDNEAMLRLLELLESEKPQLRVGANRSRGMGLVQVSRLIPQPEASVRDRITRFKDDLNSYIYRLFAFYQQIGEAQGKTLETFPEQVAADFNQERYFTVDLTSPAIITDATGLPSPSNLLDGLPAQIVRGWYTSQRVSGWHAVARLPRRAQIAISGTFLCKLDDTLNNDSAISSLQVFETSGVGLFRDHGYGQVHICYEAHTRHETT